MVGGVLHVWRCTGWRCTGWRCTAWLEVYWLEASVLHGWRCTGWRCTAWLEVYLLEVYIISSCNSITIHGRNKLKMAGPNVYNIFKNQYNNEQRI